MSVSILQRLSGALGRSLESGAYPYLALTSASEPVSDPRPSLKLVLPLPLDNGVLFLPPMYPETPGLVCECLVYVGPLTLHKAP